MKKLFVAHTITASQGGMIVGVYLTYTEARRALLQYMPDDGCTDWGHFIREYEIGKPFIDVTSLPRARNHGR